MKYKIGRFDKSMPLFHMWHVERPELLLDFRFEVDGCLLRVPSKEHTDGESTPDLFNAVTGDSYSWRNLGPALIHDAACDGDLQVFGPNGWVPVYFYPLETGALFHDFSLKWNSRPPTFKIGVARKSLIFTKWLFVTPAVFIMKKHISYRSWRKKNPRGIVFSRDFKNLAKYNPLLNLEGGPK